MTGAQQKEEGFTIAELLTVLVVSTLLMTLVFSFFWQYWQYAERAQSDIDVFTSRLDLGDYIREVVGTTSGLIIQNSIDDTNANVPMAPGSNYWQEIHPVPKTIARTDPAGERLLLYFKRYSQDTSGAFIYNDTTPYEDEHLIYLTDTGEMRVRILANPDASGNVAKTSCPLAIASATCPADRLLIDNVDSIAVRYFSRAGNLLDWTPSTDPETGDPVYGPDFPAVEVVEYTVNISKRAFTQTTNTTKSSTIIRIALRNT